MSIPTEQIQDQVEFVLANQSAQWSAVNGCPTKGSEKKIEPVGSAIATHSGNGSESENPQTSRTGGILRAKTFFGWHPIYEMEKIFQTTNQMAIWELFFHIFRDSHRSDIPSTPLHPRGLDPLRQSLPARVGFLQQQKTLMVKKNCQKWGFKDHKLYKKKNYFGIFNPH